jgi:hypothetical protein
MSKRIRPTPQNRQAMIDATWREVNDSLTYRIGSALPTNRALADHAIAHGKAGGLSVNCSLHFHDLMEIALAKRGRREPEADDYLRRAFAFMYWGNELAVHLDRQEPGFAARDGCFLDRFWFHGLAIAGGATELADWIGLYLLKGLKGGVSEYAAMLQADPAFHGLARSILEIQARGEWPESFETAALKGFGPLLETAAQPERFRATLVGYCDYRLAQTWGYDSLDAPRRRPASIIGSVFDGRGWIGLVPLELYSLKYVFERSTGKMLSLDAEHPLLHPRFMQIPALLPLHQDSDLLRVPQFGQRAFGAAWKPLSP